MADTPDPNQASLTPASQPDGSPASETVKILHPTIASERLLRVQIPHNEDGRRFIRDLEHLLQTKNLPFYTVCTQKPAAAAGAAPAPEAEKLTMNAQGEDGGSTTSSLTLNLDQIGWPP